MTSVKPQRLSVVTLGVSDLARSREFYERWGWTPKQESDEIVFFEAGGSLLALFDRSELAADQNREGEELGTGAVTVAQAYPTEADVDSMYDRAVLAGARVLKRPVKTDWGGYSGYIADPDDHVWELIHVPYWDVEADGSVSIPEDDESA
jgi:predicted lactoylglutathione lyase